MAKFKESSLNDAVEIIFKLTSFSQGISDDPRSKALKDSIKMIIQMIETEPDDKTESKDTYAVDPDQGITIIEPKKKEEKKIENLPPLGKKIHSFLRDFLSSKLLGVSDDTIERYARIYTLRILYSKDKFYQHVRQELEKMKDVKTISEEIVEDKK